MVKKSWDRRVFIRRLLTLGIPLAMISRFGISTIAADETFCGHRVRLDSQGRIIPWFVPTENAYDHFLRERWDFIKSKVPNCPGPPPRSSYPQYYFYCAYMEFKSKDGLLVPDTWMNDVAEKIPNWFESARLYYAYTGDSKVMTIVRRLMDYTLAHGTSPSTFAWPNFPQTAANAGDMEFRGFTSAGKFVRDEVEVGYSGDMGLAYYRMYLYSGDQKYLAAAVNCANTLVDKARNGTSTQSVWPYRVVMDDGYVTAEYGANWVGCWMLLDHLTRASHGKVNGYENARSKTRDFLLQYPVKTGHWTDGHTDNPVDSNTYKSNTPCSNFVLACFDFPELDPEWRTDIPRLIRWTETNFVYRCAPGEPATQWGANIAGEQDGDLHKMDYQTARYAAQCARWYAVSGDKAYKEKAYRALNWVTYCNNRAGQGNESPLSTEDQGDWWSDEYGECPRMFYQAFAGIPEWAPPRQNHILYSAAVLKNVSYEARSVEYTATEGGWTEYLRLAFHPGNISLNGVKLSMGISTSSPGYSLRDLGNGDYAVMIRRMEGGRVVIR